MATGFFGDIAPIRYEGATSENPLAYRYYDATRVVMGKTIAEHLRPAVCYWHNFAWAGSDMFGVPTFERPWFAETMAAARQKADVAFEMFSLLGVPFFTFHDRDVVPEGASLADFGRNLAEITEYFQEKIEQDRRQAPCGARPICSAIPATCRARRPTPTRTCSPMRRRR